jgi:probable phosphoglycerate mutase
MRVVLVRHGETEENAAHILQGHSYGTLTARGKIQISRLAERLLAEPITKILSSDLVRASYTSEQIAASRGIPIVYHQELRERCLGGFEGGPVASFIEARKASDIDELEFSARGSESLIAVDARARKAWNEIILPVAEQGLVLVSSHGLFNRVLLSYILGRGLRQIYELEQENTCVNIIERDDQGALQIPLINCTSHLKEDELNRRGVTQY